MDATQQPWQVESDLKPVERCFAGQGNLPWILCSLWINAIMSLWSLPKLEDLWSLWSSRLPNLMLTDAPRAFAYESWAHSTCGEKEASIRCMLPAFQKPASIKKRYKWLHPSLSPFHLLEKKKNKNKNLKHPYNFNGEDERNHRFIFLDFVRSSSVWQLSLQFLFWAPTS